MNRISNLSNRRNVYIARALMTAILVGALLMPAGLNPIAPNVVEAQSGDPCRIQSTLPIQNITKGFLMRVAANEYRIRFELNQTRHAQFCESPLFGCGVRDKYAFRPPLSFNVFDADDLPDFFFPECQRLWKIVPANSPGDVIVGFKVLFNEDIVLTGIPKPSRKSFAATIRRSTFDNLVIGGEHEITADLADVLELE